MKKGISISLIALALAGCGDGPSNLDKAINENTDASAAIMAAAAFCGEPKLCEQVNKAKASLASANEHLQAAKKADGDDWPWWGIALFIVAMAFLA